MIFLGSTRTASAQVFIPFGLGNPVFNYGYGLGGYGSWGYYPGGIGFNYLPRSYGAFTNYGYPAFPTAYTGYTSTNPYYNGYNATLAAQASYMAPAASSLAPITYFAVAGRGREVAAEYIIPDQPARVIVHVPAGTELWFNGHKTSRTGTERTFSTPPLEKGSSYHYDVRARWRVDGKPTEDTQTVQVYAGGEIHVTFPRAK
jgi:uncharacterized protein (TIGR03000 family)